MRNSTYRKTLDVQKQGSQFTVNAVQGETASRQLVLTIQDGGKPFDFETDALVAVLYVEKPDGDKEFNDEISRDGNKLTVTIPASMIDVAGDVRARVRIVSGANQVLYTPEFTIFVDACDIDDESAEAQNYYSLLVGALAQASNVNVELDEEEDYAVLTITDREGHQTSVEVPLAHGGGTEFDVDSTLKLINGILGVSFAQETQSGLESGKAVRSNEFNAAMSIINDTFGNIYNQINSKQNTLTAGSNITIVNDVISASGGGGGTSDYSQLANKPSINSVELNGNKSLADLGIQPSGDYATITALNSGLATKQNLLTAGQNVSINNNVISAGIEVIKI